MRDERLKVIIDNSPFPIAVVDVKDHHIQHWSKSAIQLFGHNPKTSEEWYELAYPNPEYRKEVVERWKSFLQTAQNAEKAVNTGAYEISCKNGSVKICEIYAQFIPGALIITLNDITKRTKADDKLKALNQQLLANEQQLKAANQQLQASEQQLKAANEQLSANEQQLRSANESLIASENQYRSLFNSMQEGVYLHSLVYDDQGNACNYRIIEANPISEEYLNIKREDAIGKLATELFGTQEAPFLDTYSKVAETGEPYSFELFFEPMNKHFLVSVFSPAKGSFATVFLDITEKKKTEKDLLQNHYYLSKAQEIGNIGTWELDLLQNQLIWTDENYKIFGVPIGTPMTYELFLNQIHPDDREYVNTEWNAALKTKSYDIEHRLLIGDQVKWVREKADIEFDDKGNAIKAIGFTQDITERNLAEKEFKESEERFRELVNTLNSGVAIYEVINDGHSGADYIIKEFNEFALKHEQLEKQDIVGKSLRDIRPNIDEYGLIDMFQKVWKTGEPTFFPAKEYVDEKYSNYYENRIFRLPSGEIVAIYDDVSDRENATARIKENQERFNLAMKASKDGLYDWNLSTNEIYYSPGWKSMLGYDEEALPNDFTVWEKLTDPKDVERSWKIQQELINKQRDRFEIEFRMKHKNGHWVDILSRAEAVLIGTHVDISELKQTELELLKAKQKAEESDRLKSAFLANMSHEIRTPMNGILGFSNLLKKPNLTGQQQKKYIGIIEKSGTRMLNIINDIVDISKIEAGLMALDITESNINEQIEYIYTFFKPEVDAKGIKLSFKNTLPAKEAIINTDREKVYAILTNLVKNAIKYTDKGSIEFGYNAKGDWIEFFVKDTGIGIPNDRQKAIFERFIQADISDTQARQGAGLGLSISKAYVEMLNGKKWVVSEEGKGSSFYFSIPYKKAIKKKWDLDRMNDGDESLKLDLKILIVEDDEPSSQLLSEIVDPYGREIMSLINGKEAVEACRNHPDIDLILMDIQIPGMNGYEATRHIREFNKEVIIIAQTAYGLSGDREKAMDAGCSDYISKPIDEEEFDAIIRKHFKNKR